jgi:hypothetical protein
LGRVGSASRHVGDTDHCLTNIIIFLSVSYFCQYPIFVSILFLSVSYLCQYPIFVNILTVVDILVRPVPWANLQ